MKKIGIIGAMQVEIEDIKTAMTDITQTQIAGNLFFDGLLGSTKVVLTCSGIGKVNAAVSAQILISQFGCDALINTGIAGNLSEKLHLGDFVLADCLQYHDFDADIFAQCFPFVKQLTPDTELCKKMMQALNELNIHAVTGKIATGDVFVQDSQTKQAIVEKTNALCTEMEGAAIGHVAQRNGVPFAVLRCISDDSDNEEVYNNFFETAAHSSAAVTVHTVKLLAEK